MKILVINCHPDNRGDEAAVHAMVDEISAAYPGVEITLATPEQRTLIRQVVDQFLGE